MSTNINLNIVPFTPHYRDAFLRLNRAWLEEHGLLEPYDLEVLENPETMVLEKGGEIYFGVVNDEVVSTIALTPAGEGVVELNKMAVSKEFQSRGIGQQLMHFAIQLSTSKGVKCIELYSHSSLKSALHIYAKFGFQEVPLAEGCMYDLANVHMRLELCD